MDSSRASGTALYGLLIITLTLLVGCGGFRRGPKADLQALWDFDAADALAFATQDKEWRFSALASDDKSLYLIGEREGRLLKLGYPVSPRGRFDELALWGREGADYEGAALAGDSLYLLDVPSGPANSDPPLVVKVSRDKPDERGSAYPLSLPGLDCRGGQCLSGIAVAQGAVYLLDEQDVLPGGGCAARLYTTTLGGLEAGGSGGAQALSLPLPDCHWRYTDIHPLYVGERLYLLALKTFCATSREGSECEDDAYAVEIINPQGATKVVSSYHFTEAAVRWWRMADVSRNLQGLAIGGDGALYIVSDNRWEGDRRPKSLLIRIPKR